MNKYYKYFFATQKANTKLKHTYRWNMLQQQLIFFILGKFYANHRT